MSKREFIQKRQQLQVFLNRMADELSRETGFVQRTSKLSGAGFAQTLMLGWLDNPDASLKQLTQVSADLGVAISAAGLQQRLNERAVCFLKRLVEAGLGWFQERQGCPREVLQHFSKVRIVDSSVLKLPAALAHNFKGTRVQGGQAALKVQLVFEYLTGQMEALELVAGCTPDQNARLLTAGVVPQSLTLMDLGFFKKSAFEAIAQAQGFFISRWQTQTALYWQAEDAHAFDLCALLQSRGTTPGELSVYMKATQAVAVRLVYLPLPPAVVEERRRKAQAQARRRGEVCSQRHLALLNWRLFITNVPCAWLSVEQVAMVYRVRWHIELVFKLWKSQAHLDRIGSWHLDRVLCQFYGRLLGLMVFQWLVVPYRWLAQAEMSLPQAFQIVQRHALRLLDAIADHWTNVSQVLSRMAEDIQRFAHPSKCHKSPSTYQLLLRVGA